MVLLYYYTTLAVHNIKLYTMAKITLLAKMHEKCYGCAKRSLCPFKKFGERILDGLIEKSNCFDYRATELESIRENLQRLAKLN